MWLRKTSSFWNQIVINVGIPIEALGVSLVLWECLESLDTLVYHMFSFFISVVSVRNRVFIFVTTNFQYKKDKRQRIQEPDKLFKFLFCILQPPQTKRLFHSKDCG